MDWRDEIIAAQDRIEGHVRRTPVAVLTLSGLADPCAVKLEQLQHTGSFKARRWLSRRHVWGSRRRYSCRKWRERRRSR